MLNSWTKNYTPKKHPSILIFFPHGAAYLRCPRGRWCRAACRCAWRGPSGWPARTRCPPSRPEDWRMRRLWSRLRTAVRVKGGRSGRHHTRQYSQLNLWWAPAVKTKWVAQSKYTESDSNSGTGQTMHQSILPYIFCISYNIKFKSVLIMYLSSIGYHSVWIWWPRDLLCTTLLAHMCAIAAH